LPSSERKTQTEKIYARDLRKDDVITWVGSFGRYTVLSDAEPDPTFPGRVRFKGQRGAAGQVVGTRLREDEICTFYAGWWKDRPFIQSGVDSDSG
jgi:hypothetical protein